MEIIVIEFVPNGLHQQPSHGGARVLVDEEAELPADPLVVLELLNDIIMDLGLLLHPPSRR